MSNAATSLYPPPPAYCEVLTSDDNLPDPPPPVEGQFTTFGITGSSAVSIPQLVGADLIPPDKKGVHREFLWLCVHKGHWRAR